MRTSTVCSVILAVSGLITVPACGGDADVQMAIVRDSIGITIVENPAGIWEGGQEWTVTTSPSLNIGVLEGAQEYQLFRVHNALRMTNGNIVVAESNELRFYDSEGRYLSTSGREGGGPGEFQQLGWVKPYPGDSIVAYDFGQVRVSLLDENGNFGRSHRIIPEGEFGFVMGESVFADGTLLVKAPQLFRGGISEGNSRDEEHYHTYSPTGVFLDSVASLPGPDQFIQTGADGENRWVAVRRPPFGRVPVMATFGNRFYYGSADSYEIECHAQDGTLEMIVRRNYTQRPVTDDDVTLFVERQVEDIEDETTRRQTRDAYEDMNIPEVMPAYEGLIVDELGNLWVQEFNPDPDAKAEWMVFTADGQMLGSVMLAANFEVNQIGDDFVLGVWRDEFDVEHVHMYGLVKPTRDIGGEL